MKKLLMTLGVFGLLFIGQDVMAQSVTHKQVHQHKRIHHGVKKGTITPREAKALRVQQAHIRSMKRVAMADGRITPGERVIINRAQRRASKNIYHKKHNVHNRRY